MKITNQTIANILKVVDGINQTEIQLPEAEKVNHAEAWSEWVDADLDYLGTSVEGGEFLAYRLLTDSGEAVTLVLFSWSQGGFDGAVLESGHAATIEDAATMWLGDMSAGDEEFSGHSIREVVGYEEEEEEEDEA